MPASHGAVTGVRGERGAGGERLTAGLEKRKVPVDDENRPSASLGLW